MLKLRDRNSGKLTVVINICARFLVSLTNSVTPVPKGSSQYSQETVTCSYLKPTESTVLPQPTPRSHSDPIHDSVFQVVSFRRTFPPKPCTISLLSHSCHMPLPSHSPWFDLPNNILGWVQVMKFFVVQLPPLSFYFIPLLPKYSP
jgi:hypothetical protein